MTTPSHASPASPASAAETTPILGDHDPLAETLAWLLKRFGPLDVAVLRTPKAPRRWSLTQVLAHLADVEIAMGWRARILLMWENAPLQGPRKSSWMTRFGGAIVNPTEALRIFETLRARGLPVWTRADANRSERTSIHSRRGPELFDTLRRMVAGHNLRHRRQAGCSLPGPA